MIEKEIVEFKQWLEMLGVVPVISALTRKGINHSSRNDEKYRTKTSAFN